MHCRSHWIWNHRLGSVKARQSDALSSLKESGSHKSLSSAMEVFCRSLFLLFTVRLPKAHLISNSSLSILTHGDGTNIHPEEAFGH